MRRPFLPEALLDTDQEIPGAFSGNPKLHSDDFEWLGLMHVIYLAGIVAPDSLHPARAVSRWLRFVHLLCSGLPLCPTRAPGVRCQGVQV